MEQQQWRLGDFGWMPCCCTAAKSPLGPETTVGGSGTWRSTSTQGEAASAAAMKRQDAVFMWALSTFFNRMHFSLKHHSASADFITFNLEGILLKPWLQFYCINFLISHTCVSDCLLLLGQRLLFVYTLLGLTLPFVSCDALLLSTC